MSKSPVALMQQWGSAIPRGVGLVAVLILLGTAACARSPEGDLNDAAGAEGLDLSEAESASAAPGDASRTRVVLLGTGTPNADPERSGPSLAIVVDDRSYLVDAGPGLVRRAAAAAEKHDLDALRPGQLSRVFLTHLHSDHTVGLPDVVFTPWVLERTEPLALFGPPGTEAMAEHIAQAYGADVAIRLGGLEPANGEGYRIEAQDVVPGVVFQDEWVTVTAFAVPHATWEHAYGYRFDTPDRTIVVSGDTGPAPEVMARMCDGCDVLVHEAYAQIGWEKRDPVWQRYHAAAHTSGPELGRIAQAARPGLLVLTHQLLWLGATPDDLLREISAEFDGAVAYGNDLDVY